MLFRIRGGTENHKVSWSDVELRSDENGKKYLEFNERETKQVKTELIFEHFGPSNLPTLMIPPVVL